MHFVKVGLVLLVIGSCVLAATIRVPQDQGTIQAGINAAVDGDTVLVGPGVYQENLDLHEKSLVLTARAGVDSTFLEGATETTPLILCSGSIDSTAEVSGFTFQNASANHVIPATNGSRIRIVGNRFRFLVGNLTLIYCNDSHPRIERNVFYANAVGNACVGVYQGNSSAEIMNNSFVSNSRGFYCLSGLAIAENNIVVGSTEYGIFGSFGALSFNDVWNNGTNYDGGATPGEGDISADPSFRDLPNQIFRLAGDSPCIDAGDPDPIYNDPDGSRNDIGAYYYVNTPPTAPELRLPADGSVVQLPQPILTVRTPSDAEGDSLLLTFEVTNDSSFAFFVPFTAQPSSDSLTTVNVPFYLTEDQHYWWRVKASDYYEESPYSAIWSFWLNGENIAPTHFDLLSPPDGLTPALTTTTPNLQWTRSRDFDPFDSVRYELHIALYPIFSFATIITGITDTSYQIIEPLSWGTNYWWKVKATDLSTGVTWSNQVFSFRVMKIGDPDGNGQISISDAVFLINYIFAGGPAPVPLLSGDADCSGAISISDAVYLINYIFAAGPAPCEP